MQIEIAGAGAGKTTKLAEKIIEQEKITKNKNIYCVSFTNTSVDVIKEKLEQHYGTIPHNIKISTIHSFLYSELIDPYNYLLYGMQFNEISNLKLDSDIKIKNYKISQLEKQGILHVEQFSKKAKFIVKEKSSDRKKIKDIRKNILKSIVSYFGFLYVDEAQDINKEFMEIILELDNLGLSIELIGDPKQDLKGYNNLKKLVSDFPEQVNYIKESYRCPLLHLKLSNTYVPELEKQISTRENEGTINLIYESEINSLQKYIDNKDYGLMYIYQKYNNFDTQAHTKKEVLFEKIKYVIYKKMDLHTVDVKVIKTASKVTHYLISSVQENNLSAKDALKKIFPYGTIEKKDYVDLLNALENETTSIQIEKIKVQSIDSVKGMEEDNCLFIVTPPMVPYMLKKKIKGKLYSSLYVALTRSKYNLDILFTKDVEIQYTKEYINTIFSAIIK